LKEILKYVRVDAHNHILTMDAHMCAVTVTPACAALALLIAAPETLSRSSILLVDPIHGHRSHAGVRGH
jgi:hypothetical protein